MEQKDFERLFTIHTSHERDVMLARGDVYAGDAPSDRLANFKEGALQNDEHPTQYAFGLFTKPFLCVKRTINTRLKGGDWAYTPENRRLFEEWITDARNYLMIILALYMEEHRAYAMPHEYAGRDFDELS